MEYLYALQNFREAAPGFVTYFFLFISEFFLVACPVFAAVVYWSINKKEGALMLIGYSGARYVNQTVKNIACVYRPWILDSRLHVERHAAKTATGYSFPSGHTTTATAVFGQTAIYQKSRKWLVACCAVFILLVAFSRNFLGARRNRTVRITNSCNSDIFKKLHIHKSLDIFKDNITRHNFFYYTHIFSEKHISRVVFSSSSGS